MDIDQDEESRLYVQEVNNGRQIIPTIVFEDGSVLVEPSNAELAAKDGELVLRQSENSTI